MQRRRFLHLSGTWALRAPLAAGAAALGAPALLRRARAAGPEPVDVELILAVDASRSIDAEEHEAQMRGYAGAFRDPEVIRAIQGGGIGAIACTLFTWSDTDSQEDLVPWARIDGPAAAGRFADAIDSAPRRTWSYTSISGAMEHAMRLYRASGHEGTRRVLDISGDGINNAGPRVAPVRARLIEAGIILNGLAVVDRAPGAGAGAATLEDYYRDEVIGGPGAFLVVAEGFTAFERAVRRKIAREVALLGTGPYHATLPRVDRVVA